MDEHQLLLNEARKFCNPVSGEVVELIPDDLMRRLRAAKLAIGIRGEESPIATKAKWFVFLDDNIRDLVLPRWRKARRQRQHTRRPENTTPELASTCDTQCSTQETKATARGLRGFVQRRKPG